jgi:hypothetical protein
VAAPAVGLAVVIGAVAEVNVIAGDPVVVVTRVDSAGAMVSARRSRLEPPICLTHPETKRRVRTAYGCCRAESYVFVSAQTDRFLHLNLAELMLKMKALKRGQRMVHAVSYCAGGLAGCVPMPAKEVGAIASWLRQQRSTNAEASCSP